MSAAGGIRLIMAGSVGEAVAALAEFGGKGTPLAGGTWLMRAPVRGECWRAAYVGIGRIDELNAIGVTREDIRIGACLTHARLIATLSGIDPFSGLLAAASGAANPAIRQMATVGGNLCTWDFPASDLVPALLALDAKVELASGRGRETIPLASFIERRRTLEPGTLLTGVTVARKPLQTGHARLPLRKAGDYPVAIVSMAASFASDGTVEDMRVAVGSVEPSPKRWHQLEEQLRGQLLDPAKAWELAKARADDFVGRDSVEAPGWYRVQVLPTLVKRATLAILSAAPG